MSGNAGSLSIGAHIAIAGAGSIGCFIGGLLIRAGRRVTLLVRSRIAEELKNSGLRLTGLGGLDVRLPPERVVATTDPNILRDAELIIVTAKSGDTAALAKEIAARGHPRAVVVSLQNGVENRSVLKSALPSNFVLGGMVGFNVVHKGEGWFHRGTSGDLVIEAGRRDLLALLSVPGLKVKAALDITAVQWGKLLLNLNNALNALSGLPLRQELEDRKWRRLLADQIDEALHILAAASINPARVGALAPRFIPAVLRLPDALFRLAAAGMLKIDPEARSSMWEDIVKGRATEVDYLQGAIASLAEAQGLDAPLSRKVCSLVRQAESLRRGSPMLSPEEIRP